ncbi:aspartate aminotransferase family protein [Clostridium thermosuccinogenes]|jgi:acetylornithine aminotransferase/acetylornithine/N-succinyldiaminopimelate aminotransferase|uniref:Acetylornithine aminotransferase n=1 Tax=Clostridium thermosuccinogenes TaxID=84032 RepID=A0A2K2FCN9_9CLOT|nr:acetylornithine transaminase [Pseudoclostridium thermosuccinogenes]AUS95510.1 aspartate aminotransferase family protein [Pseudoclostridium thermosuccinogenes]PNT96536.1 aspartate aminotransferase family protein [Pseudoclostridium thermosuccinogenes]PNT98279.1 aspartate aminotransferase family protein [Pseudoclostridium thermosuccinogenes]
MKLNEIIEMDKKYYMNTFGSRTPACFVQGKGINLWDTDGKKYYDFLGGIAVNALGHCHPALVSAISRQASELMHCSNLYYIEPQAKLAKLLVENSCADRVFFANSGAEANEGAIKLARAYFKKKGMPGKYEIITLKNSFHGRTMTTTAATGQDKYHKPYEPLTPGFIHVPLNDRDALQKAIKFSTCAIMMEPIQGESGVNPATKDYMQFVRDLCDKHGLLLILDEVQTGLGRTGKLFGYEHFEVEPDIFTLAKALGGGFPIGALCAKEHVASAFEPGDHGSTFGGNPLACTAGLTTLSIILEEKLAENAENVGNYFFEKLSGLSRKYSQIAEIRGTGLMIGVEFTGGIAKEVKDKLFESGYLVGSVGTKVLRLLPPLILTKPDVDGFIEALDKILCGMQ